MFYWNGSNNKFGFSHHQLSLKTKPGQKVGSYAEEKDGHVRSSSWETGLLKFKFWWKFLAVQFKPMNEHVVAFLGTIYMHRDFSRHHTRIRSTILSWTIQKRLTANIRKIEFALREIIWTRIVIIFSWLLVVLAITHSYSIVAYISIIDRV